MKTVAYLHPTADHCVSVDPKSYANPRRLVLRSEAVDEITRLLAELAECKQDAERYRWLRYPRMGWDIVRKTDGELLCAEYLDGIELDAAIDAARKGEGESNE